MFGGSPARNMVNLVEHNLPTDWCLEADRQRNVKWAAELGTKTFSSPVVAEGMVFIGTCQRTVKDGVRTDHAVLRAFRESDGALVWENVHDPHVSAFGLSSTPAVAGRRIYYVTPTSVVICADIDNGKIVWQYDMVKELKVSPGQPNACPACFLGGNACSPLVVGNHVFVVTANGRDFKGDLLAPTAPSFVALHRATGALAWHSNLPGTSIAEATWSNPAFADVKGNKQVIFAGGDGVIYGFVPATGQLLWKCDCLPHRGKLPRADVDNYFIGTPVVVGDKVYVGLGLHPDHSRASHFSYFLCLDITKKGDVSLKGYDANAPANKGSALVWAFGGPIAPEPRKGRPVYFGKTLSTAAVHDGLVYITEESGYLHCLDAVTGQRVWLHDFKESVWSSPLWVDGKIYVGTQGGEVVIFAAGREAKVIDTIEMDDQPIASTPVAANGTLYFATHRKLFAIGAR
jgi:outer membrane protein assembly factor BamB